MADYEREFSRLSHYAGNRLSSSKERCKRFETSLKPNLRMQVVGFRYNKFSELISQTLELERMELEATPAKEKLEKTEKSKKDKGEKSVEQSPNGTSRKKKKLGGPSRGRGGRFGRGRFSG